MLHDLFPYAAGMLVGMVVAFVPAYWIGWNRRSEVDALRLQAAAKDIHDTFFYRALRRH